MLNLFSDSVEKFLESQERHTGDKAWGKIARKYSMLEDERREDADRMIRRYIRAHMKCEILPSIDGVIEIVEGYGIDE